MCPISRPSCPGCAPTCPKSWRRHCFTRIVAHQPFAPQTSPITNCFRTQLNSLITTVQQGSFALKKRCGNAPTRRIVPCRGLDRGKGAGGCKSDFFLLHELLWRSVGSPLSQPKVVPTGNNPSLQMQTQSNIEALCDVSRV